MKRRGKKAEESDPVKFPSFFTAESPFPAPYFVRNETEAAELVHASLNFRLGSGILLAGPMPKVISSTI